MDYKKEIAEDWNERGIKLSDSGKEAEAIECYDKAIALAPECDDVWYNKARSLSSLGREDEAIECFDEAIRLNFEDAEYFYYESISLANLKRDGEAQEARNQALKLNPNIVAEEEGNEKAEKGRDNPEASEGRLSDKNIIKNELGNNQPGRAFESWSKNTNMKYPAIADLIGIFKWAATTCLFLMVLTGMVVIAMAFSAGQYTGTGGFVAILAFGLGIELLLGLGWLLTKAFSELFQVFIDIEENTRKKE